MIYRLLTVILIAWPWLSAANSQVLPSLPPIVTLPKTMTILPNISKTMVCYARRIRCLTRFGSRFAGSYFVPQTAVKKANYTICLPFNGLLTSTLYQELEKRCTISFPATCSRLAGYCIPKLG